MKQEPFRREAKESPGFSRGEDVKSLRQHRRRHMWTIRELAAQAGVNQQTIVNIELGHRDPRFATMQKIAAALGVEPLEVAEFARAINAEPTSGDN